MSEALMPFPRSFTLLAQEGHLAQGTLSVGLTSLRTAIFPDLPRFYSGLFNTSVALERIMKLIVVCDHMIAHAYTAPTKEDLKRHGHDLVELFASCTQVRQRQGLEQMDAPIAGSIEGEILALLSEFAKLSRYYNLDALNAAPGHYGNPLVGWARILQSALQADAPEPLVARTLANAKSLGRALEGVTFTIQHDPNGDLLSTTDCHVIAALQTMATPYAMVRVFRILKPLFRTLSALGRRGFYESPRHEGPRIPEFSEFFWMFGGSDSEIRKKRRWP